MTQCLICIVQELINAWFKEERKPSPEEESSNKLTSQEGNNEYAKKRWLRQAISEEGDNLLPRPGKCFINFVISDYNQIQLVPSCA